MKKWKQLTKTIFASVMALALVAGYGVSISALELQDSGFANTPLATAVMQKKLEIPPSLPVPDVTFSYDFTFQSFNGATTIDSIAIFGGTEPTIGSVTVTFAPSDTSAVDAMPATLAAHDGHGVVTKDTTSIIAQMPVYTRAGEYVYHVKENASTLGTFTGVMSGAEYEMTVFVENEVDSIGRITATSEPYVKAVGFEVVKNDAGAGVPKAKADPIFINRYAATTDLTIGKTVVGASADTEQEFEYSLTLTKINASTGTDEYGATLNGSAIATNFISFSGNETETIKTFHLKHGDKLVIEDLPAGTTYTITEIGTSGYVPSVGVIINGAAEIQAVQGTVTSGASMTVGHNGDTDALELNGGPIILGIGNNEVQWINTRDYISPTGILLNNLPYILLIVVALAGFTGYIVSKRRKARR